MKSVLLGGYDVGMYIINDNVVD